MKYILLSIFFVISTTIFVNAQELYLSEANSNVYHLPEGISEDDCIPNKLVIKLKPQYRGYIYQGADYSLDINKLDKALRHIHCVSIERVFPKHSSPRLKKNKFGEELVDLSLIYILEFNGNFSLEAAANELLFSGMLDYAEPYFKMKPLYTPNDPKLPQQIFLNRILAKEAWDIAQGDTNIIIGISDTGVDIDHPDLVGNIKYNYDDPIDGKDNDNNGFVDDYRGWDFSDNDNNPNIEGEFAQDVLEAHGVYVSGIACASTDNGVGVTGVGFKSKFIPAKLMNDENNGFLINTYESIVYLVDRGCDIINCSWGSSASAGRYGQDVINYASVNNNCLVVAAAGNENNTKIYYPASYHHVISVTGTYSDKDNKWSDRVGWGANYNKYVDIAAPGFGLYTTIDGGYGSAYGGTSWAAPCVSGAAALVKAKYPNFTGEQIGELLKATADIVDTMQVNLPYIGMMGSGRLNIYRALTEFNKPSLNISNLYVKDNNDSIFNSGDTIFISVDMINYLAATNDLAAELSSESASVTIMDNYVHIGALGTMEMKNTDDSPFVVVVNQDATINKVISFMLTLTDGTYVKQFSFSLNLNTDYVNISNGAIETSIMSGGRIGFLDAAHSQGKGFTYKGSYLLSDCIGLLIGNQSNKVSGSIYSLDGIASYSNDFKMINRPSLVKNPLKSTYQITGSMNDNNAGLNKLGIDVNYNFYLWEEKGQNNFIIGEYELINNSGVSISNLYVGMYSNWDIGDKDKNIAKYDNDLQMGYVYRYKFDDYYGAIKLLMGKSLRYYAVDNDGTFGSYNILDGFTDTEKWNMLKTSRFIAGENADNIEGKDVSHLISAGPYSLGAEDTVKVAFAIIVGESFEELKNSALKTEELYYKKDVDGVGLVVKENINTCNIYPNPANEYIEIDFGKSDFKKYNVNIYDVYGRLMMAFDRVQSNIGINLAGLPKGIYTFVILDNESIVYRKNIVKN